MSEEAPGECAESEVCTLVMLIGLPKSGKSTAAADLGIPIVCPDAIRLALHGQRYVQRAERQVWTIAHAMVRALFHAGHRRVALDACNTSRRRRDEWIAWASDEILQWEREALVCKTTRDTCVKRAEDVGDHEIVPVIDRMSEAIDPISPDENFRSIVSLDHSSG